MWAVQLCRTACDYHAHNSVYVHVCVDLEQVFQVENFGAPLNCITC